MRQSARVLALIFGNQVFILLRDALQVINDQAARQEAARNVPCTSKAVSVSADTRFCTARVGVTIYKELVPLLPSPYYSKREC